MYNTQKDVIKTACKFRARDTSEAGGMLKLIYS